MDALIAACADSLRAPLVTLNLKHFPMLTEETTLVVGEGLLGTEKVTLTFELLIWPSGHFLLKEEEKNHCFVLVGVAS